MKKLLIILFCILSITKSNAQNLVANKILCDSTYGIIGLYPNGSNIIGVGTSTVTGLGNGLFVKYDANYNIILQKTYGGSGFDGFFGLQKMSDNKFLIYGRTESTDGDLQTSGWGQTTLGDIWLLIIDSNGNILKSTTYGYGGGTTVTNAHVRADGYIFVTGYTYSKDGDFINNPKPVLTTASFVAYLDSNLNKKWIRFTNNNFPISDEFINASCLDVNNNLIIAATGDSIGELAYPKPYGTSFNLILLCIDSNKQVLWGNTYGGNNGEAASSLWCDSANNLYVAGSTNSNTGDLRAPEAILKVGSQEWYGFLFKLDSNRNMLWRRNYGSFDTLTPSNGNKTMQDQKVFIHNNTIWLANIISGTDAYNFGTGFGVADVWLLKLDTLGLIKSKLRMGSSKAEQIFGNDIMFWNTNTNKLNITCYSAPDGLALVPSYFICASKNTGESKILEIDYWANSVKNVAQSKIDWSINPNPNNGIMDVQFVQAFTGTISIVALNGTTIKKYKITNSQKHQILVPALVKGNYIIEVKNKTTKESKTIVVQ